MKRETKKPLDEQRRIIYEGLLRNVRSQRYVGEGQRAAGIAVCERGGLSALNLTILPPATLDKSFDMVR
jgi:hypothetical protein